MLQPKPKKVKKRGALYGPLTFLIVCAALVFGVGVFFRVTDIEVVGASYYSEQEIADASGIEKGDNLFFINRFTAYSKIYAKLPYVSSVEISRRLPNRIVIEVDESSAIACIRSEGEYWLIDKNCKILSSAGAADAVNLINITGLVPSAPVVGEELELETGDSTAVEFVSDVLTAMSGLDMLGSVTYLDMTNISDPMFDYLGRFTVKLGRDDAVEYKLELMLSAVAQLGEGDEGMLDLSIDKKVHFSPY